MTFAPRSSQFRRAQYRVKSGAEDFIFSGSGKCRPDRLKLLLGKTKSGATAIVGYVACVALAALSACSHAAPAAQPSGGSEAIECALHGAAGFVRACTVERIARNGGAQLVVRHPDGGFRRFDLPQDGKGPATADGAEPARVRASANGFDVTVGNDRYRFPAAQVRPDGR